MSEQRETSRITGQPETLRTAFAAGAGDVARALDVTPASGLSPREASARLRRYGPNLLREKRPRSVLAILGNQLRSLVVALLSAAAVISLAFGNHAEGAAILVVLAFNTALGFVMEWRAVRSMEALQRLAQVPATVRRGGELRSVSARDLVPGDVVVVEGGDVVTADLRLVHSADLQADESTLTGESTPVAKTPDTLPPDTMLPDRCNMLFKGTSVVRGSGEGVVVATGMATELGRIASLAQEADSGTSPLTRRLDGLAGRLVWLTLAIAAAIALVGIWHGQDIRTMVETAVALAVAAVPEGLPVVATLTLARGMLRMARNNALLSRLSAVETLGSTTIILTDKTGTLTENRMSVSRYLLPAGDVEVTHGHGGDRAVFRGPAGAVDARAHAPLRAAIEVGALCGNAEIGESDGSAIGDPLEIALLDVAARAGLPRARLIADHPERREHGFDHAARMMATVHAAGDGYLIAVKGAPEAILTRCERVLAADGPEALDDDGRADWLSRCDAAARRGFRLIALARREARAVDDDPYADLTLCGIACLIDPIREDVPPAIAACLAAGVRVVLVTGDHAGTAIEIAEEAGIARRGQGRLIEGRDIAGLDLAAVDDATARRLREADVFARVTPETKLDLVDLHQRAGGIVAMTGDGVNDAPALRKADIGIAMGRRGTQVAREAADMVLKDDAFPTIVTAMREGRAIFANIRRFVVYLMSCNLSELMVVGLSTLAGLPLPLLPLQILFLNLVTDVFPAFALGLGEGSRGAMHRPPRDPAEPILRRRDWARIGLYAATITVATLAAFGLSLQWLALPVEQAVTVSFTTLALAQLWHVFNMRDASSGPLRNEVTANPYVHAALVGCIGLIGLSLFLPGLSSLLGLPHPGWPALGLALVASLLPLPAGFAVARIVGGRRRGGSHAPCSSG